MRSYLKPVIAIMLAAALLLSFAACNKGGSKHNEGGNNSSSPTAAPAKTNAPASTLSPNVAVVTFKGIANGDCGESSRWVLKINGSEVTGSYDKTTVSNGDEVIWLYVIG